MIKGITIPDKIPFPTSQVCYQELTATKIVNFCLEKDIFLPINLERVTSLAVVPFADKDHVVCSQLKRGVDLPGGHVEKKDADIVSTLYREVLEEVGITLDTPLILIGVITSDLYGDTKGDKSYMLILVANATLSDKFVPKFESSGREKLTPEEFLEKYPGPNAFMFEIIKRAIFAKHEIL